MGWLCYFCSSTGWRGIEASTWGVFFWKNWSTLWLVLAITSVALGRPLPLPVGGFFATGVCTREALLVAVRLAS